jgi:hypothetical protein
MRKKNIYLSNKQQLCIVRIHQIPTTTMASTYRSINSDVSNLSSIVNTTMTAMPDAVPTTPTAMGLPVTEGTLLIPELLIAVIGFLPYRDNGKVRRVSKKLRDTIDDSLTIRQQRFLDADPKAGGRPIYIWTGGLPWSHHKIVGHPSGHFTPPESLGIFANRDPEQFVPRSVVKVHPLLPVSKGGRWIDRVGAHMTFPWDLKEMLAWEEGGTWEKAFLTQPPVQNITLWVVYIESETPSIETRKGWLFKMSDKDGLRFRHVVKELKATTFMKKT